MGPILKVDDINVYYGSIHAIKGITCQVARAADRYSDRRQRRREIHHAEHHRRPGAHKTGSVTFLGEDLSKVPRPQGRVQGHAAGARGTPRLFAR